jgi:uncharacterized protein with FMN-binding domain
MRRALFAVAGTVTGLVGVLSFHPHTPASTAGASSKAGVKPPSSTPSAAVTQDPSRSSSPSNAPPTTSTKNVTGTAIDTRYGMVQVGLTASGKTVTDITVLQSPDREGRDVEIGNYALPILHDEAIQAQNANIQMVGGATYTSDGYIRSLQSALDQL